jgi:hypothetical protein
MRNAHLVGRILVVILLAVGPHLALGAGILRIASSADDIAWSVQIDGEPITYFSGVEVQLEAGRHRIVATAPGYQPIDGNVTISDGVVTVVTLSPERSRIVETTEEQTLTSRQKVSRLVVVSSPRDRPFRIDDTSSTAPASFLLGVGQHTLRSGDLELTFEIPEELVTYLKIDVDQGRILGFNMTETQEAAISASSQDELFEEGYRLYGQTRGGLLESLLGAFSVAQAALAPYVPAVSFVPPELMSAGMTGLVLALIALILLWSAVQWGRYRFGSPRAARMLVARATQTVEDLRKARLLAEASTIKRLQTRFARLEQHRSRFEVKLRSRIAKAAGVQADPEAKPAAKRTAARGTRRWERALGKLKAFPDIRQGRHTTAGGSVAVGTSRDRSPGDGARAGEPDTDESLSQVQDHADEPRGVESR